MALAAMDGYEDQADRGKTVWVVSGASKVRRRINVFAPVRFTIYLKSMEYLLISLGAVGVIIWRLPWNNASS